jgi:hypothetical protein
MVAFGSVFVCCAMPLYVGQFRCHAHEFTQHSSKECARADTAGAHQPAGQSRGRATIDKKSTGLAQNSLVGPAVWMKISTRASKVGPKFGPTR